MRVIAKRTLRGFWNSKPQFTNAEDPLSAWHAVCIRANWQSPRDVKENFRSASFVGKNVVFNIAGNKNRLVANISYSRKAIFVKFVGTHKQYDSIDVGGSVTMDKQPINTEKDYDAALQLIDELWDSGEGAVEGDRLDILITLVDAFEQINHPIYPPDPVAAIEFHMDQHELTRLDLEKYIGTRARVSEVLNRKRRLSIEMIRNLHEGLGIPLESLIARPKDSRAS